MIKLLYLFLTLIFTLTLTVTLYSECRITAGWEPYEPYQFKKRRDNFTGLDLDILKAAFNEAGCKIEFVEMPWKRMLLSVEDGNINVVMGASRLPEREKYAVFSQPYRDESFSIFMRKNGKHTYKIQRLEDLIRYNIKLGIVRGYFYGKKFDEAMTNPGFKELVEEAKDDETNIKKLEGERVDALLIDPYVGIARMKKTGFLNKIYKTPLTLTTEPIHAMFSKKSVSAETVKSFNEGLNKIKKNGKMNQIFKKYLK